MTRRLQPKPDRMCEAREIDLALLYELGPGAGHGDEAKRQSALSTSFSGAENGEIKIGDTVAVFAQGPASRTET